MAKPTKSEINGKIVGSQAIIVDITERKKMEQDLVDNQERLQRVFSASPDAITESDMNGNIVECNQATLDILELSSKEELIGKSGFEFIPEKDHQRVRENLRRTLEQGSVKNVEYTYLTKSGREIPTELSSSVLKDSSGKIVGFVSVAKDITGRKKVEEVLRASEEKHRVISSITADFVFSCVRADEEGFAIDWMAGATEEIFGYSAKEIEDKGCWKFAVQPEDLSTFEEKVTGLKPGQSGVCELRITHKDGSTRWIKVSSQVVKDSSNPANHRLFGACEDITERKKTEEELKRYSEYLENVFAASPDAITVSDLNGNVIQCNKATLDMLGFSSKEELIGQDGFSFIAKRDHQKAAEYLKKT
jgi:PAS domain S-box-containing protein